MTIKSGSIPAKDACFQCFQPPAFYWISARIGEAALQAGLPLPQVIKLLQFVGCAAGILTVAVCYPILRRFPLSDFAKLAAFGTVCFLPRHIYMSAMHSNDTFSYLFAALAVYLTMLALERRLAWPILVALGAVVTLAALTKYTAFALLPAIAAALGRAWRRGLVASRERIAAALLVAVLLPASVLAGYMLNNSKHYGSLLPWNLAIYDPSLHRPRDPGGISFVSFRPWEKLGDPMLVPGQLDSFWTLIYSGMWFDTEPYFLSYLDANRDWWQRYYAWYRGEGPFPGKNPSLSGLTILTGDGLILLGLAPLLLVAIGFALCVSGRWSRLFQATPAQSAALSLFPTLFAFNAAGVVAITLRLPVYNAMKPSYFLISTPALMVFLALGAALCEKRAVSRWILSILLGVLFALAIAHVIHIVLSIP
jgi:4-amino-4-deoxy-L-arabinose transferase-like glycosyltransferase